MGWKKARLRVKIYGREVTSNTFKHVFNYLKGYLKDNWGAPFIVAFMVMLLTAAGYIAEGLETVANDVAVYAYYSLVVGVILQFICRLKYREG